MIQLQQSSFSQSFIVSVIASAIKSSVFVLKKNDDVTYTDVFVAVDGFDEDE